MIRLVRTSANTPYAHARAKVYQHQGESNRSGIWPPVAVNEANAVRLILIEDTSVVKYENHVASRQILGDER